MVCKVEKFAAEDEFVAVWAGSTRADGAGEQVAVGAAAFGGELVAVEHP